MQYHENHKETILKFTSNMQVYCKILFIFFMPLFFQTNLISKIMAEKGLLCEETFWCPFAKSIHLKIYEIEIFQTPSHPTSLLCMST